jgi:hypothetical protein
MIWIAISSNHDRVVNNTRAEEESFILVCSVGVLTFAYELFDACQMVAIVDFKFISIYQTLDLLRSCI